MKLRNSKSPVRKFRLRERRAHLSEARPLLRLLVAGRQGKRQAFLFQFIPDPLELLVLRQSNWAGVSLALQFAEDISHMFSLIL
jgi:hypothetical protein